MMLLVVLCALPAVLTAIDLQCMTGQAVCEKMSGMSMINNKYHCCAEGFDMNLKSEIVNGTTQTDCTCRPRYMNANSETECTEGIERCSGSSNIASIGNQVYCCPNGASMNSASNSFINGVSVNYCKCVRYNGVFSNNNVGTSSYWINGRPMTPAERQQFDQEMNRFRENMNQWSHGLSHGLNSMLNHPVFDWGNNFGRNMGQWAGSLVNRMANGFGLTGPTLPRPTFHPQSDQPTSQNDRPGSVGNSRISDLFNTGRVNFPRVPDFNLPRISDLLNPQTVIPRIVNIAQVNVPKISTPGNENRRLIDILNPNFWSRTGRGRPIPDSSSNNNSNNGVNTNTNETPSVEVNPTGGEGGTVPNGNNP